MIDYAVDQSGGSIIYDKCSESLGNIQISKFKFSNLK